MGKSKSQKERRKKRSREAAVETTDDDDDLLLAAASAFANKLTVSSKKALPPAFPLPIPSHLNGFLSNLDSKNKHLYQTAMETCYEGVTWDQNVCSERRIQEALQVLDDAGFFRVDVTQPAGLGSKCAPTFVTRCLLGKEGMSYRYLGLRMFAHPWDGGKEGYYSDKVREALRTVSGLNDALTDRSQTHLKTLDSKRRARGDPGTRGRAGFDVSLINKMASVPRLKDEPMFKQSKCSVSWHADSSLEHYSTIAVYQTILNDSEGHGKSMSNKSNSHDSCWSVALRVAHNAEGPKAARLGSIVVDTKCPPITMALPSGSAYYLLDDANHHLQHAVLAPKSKDFGGTRFSSTHRLLREGAQVMSIINRCEVICQKLNHHGPKRWRVEQLLLQEVEDEWLRQFFVQGQTHKDLLWSSWSEPIRQLFRFWSKLEMRTYQIVCMLRVAARARCGLNDMENDGKDALAAIEEVYRTNNGIYQTFAQLIEDRARNRGFWLAREHDPSFKRVGNDCQPLTFPVQYNVRNGKIAADSEFLGVSPFPDGSSEFLTQLARHIKQWGKAFAQRARVELPEETPVQVRDGSYVELIFSVNLNPKKKKKSKKSKRAKHQHSS